MKKGIYIFIICIIFVIFFLLGYFFWALSHKGSGEEKEFIIKQGQGIQTISKNLADQELISSVTVFSLYAKFRGALIQVGVYKISASQSSKEILEILISGKASEYLITIPEGLRVTQIDELLANKGVINAGDLIQIASADEGYLFPDTYRFMPKTPAAEIRQVMLENFQKKTKDLKVTRETVILASIIEREAKFDDDRPKIAGVYLNRLEINMKLEADPTVQYAKGSWEKILLSDYHNVNSPYNTYLFIGLPPGPICNPGLKSIEAVLYPKKDSWLFFFHKSDGHAVYSATAEEHAENLKKYQ